MQFLNEQVGSNLVMGCEINGVDPLFRKNYWVGCDQHVKKKMKQEKNQKSGKCITYNRAVTLFSGTFMCVYVKVFGQTVKYFYCASSKRLKVTAIDAFSSRKIHYSGVRWYPQLMLRLAQWLMSLFYSPAVVMQSQKAWL